MDDFNYFCFNPTDPIPPPSAIQATTPSPLTISRSKTIRHHGKIEFIFGPMYSGKSSELFRRMRKFLAAKQRCVLIKYSGDTRYDTEDGDIKLFTHNRDSMNAALFNDLSVVDGEFRESPQPDVIGIDEVQFFGTNAFTVIEKWFKEGKHVICAGLNTSAARVPYPIAIQLMGRADKCKHLTAICKRCSELYNEKRSAPFTWGINNASGEQQIGGEEAYFAVCGTCWDELDAERLKIIPADLLLLYQLTAVFLYDPFLVDRETVRWQYDAIKKKVQCAVQDAIIFGIVWNFLYVIMAISVFLLYLQRSQMIDWAAYTLFSLVAVILITTKIWPALFFTLANPYLALIDAIALFSAISVYIAIGFVADPSYGDTFWLPSALMCIPLLWMCYALYLNAAVSYYMIDYSVKKLNKSHGSQ